LAGGESKLEADENLTMGLVSNSSSENSKLTLSSSSLLMEARRSGGLSGLILLLLFFDLMAGGGYSHSRPPFSQREHLGLSSSHCGVSQLIIASDHGGPYLDSTFPASKAP